MLKHVLQRSNVLLSQSLPYCKTLRGLSTCSHSVLYSRNPNSNDITDTTIQKEIVNVKNLRNKPLKPRPVDPDYLMIYKYPGIESVRTISRMKFFCLFGNGLMIPCCLGLEYFEYVEPYSSLIFAILGGSLTVSLSLVGILLNRFIGIIYYNAKTDIVKIASLSYKGLRIDDHVPRNQLTSFKILKYFPLLSTFSDKGSLKEYKIVAQTGVINPLVYNSIFHQDLTSEDSKPGSPTVSLPPPTEQDVNFEDIIKKVRSENEKSVKKGKE